MSLFTRASKLVTESKDVKEKTKCYCKIEKITTTQNSIDLNLSKFFNKKTKIPRNSDSTLLTR